MAETVGQHSVAAFTSPVNGTSPIDANTVKGNDNTIRSAYVDHDADPGIHVQSSTLASRPVANSAGRKWMTQDSGVIRLFYDDGTSWYEVDYLRTTGGTISGNLSITGTLAVTGVATFTAQPILSSLTASRAVFTDGSKGLVSNAITGTGDVVMSASPTLTGTITAASATLSGTLGVSGLLTFASLKGTGATTVTNILDEDNMASDSATALATQQSIKAYVDAQVGASDALSEVLAIGNTTGANDIIVSAGQKIRTPAVAAQDGSSAITIANTTGALTLATALADSNLATISTAGKVSNSATTATSANTASAIVARDASGNFTAGTITAALTGNASTATTLQTARNINGVSFNGSADITVTAAAGTLTGTTLASNVTASSLTSVGTLANLTVTNPITGSVTGSSGSTTGNAATATALQTARNINGVSFNGTADITVTAAAGTLTGTTLASGVTASSLTSVGTLSSLTVSGATTLASTSGDVAIGSTNISKYSASYKTLILDGAAATAAIQINNTTTGSGTNSGGLLLAQSGNDSYVWNPKNSFISFGTNNSEKMRLDASGNLAVDTNTLYVDAANNRVGVGTASPSVRFDVSDTAVVQRLISTSSSASDEPRLRFFHTGNDEFEIRGGDGLKFYGSSANLRMTLTSSGNLGIGRTPSGYTLDITTGGNALRMERSGVEMGGFISSGNPFWGTLTNHPFLLMTNGTERARIDASGNLGLGVTPSAWSSLTALQVGAQASISADGTSIQVGANAYFNSGWKYIGTGNATNYYQLNGAHVWRTAASGTAGNNITFTQAMTLDASSNLTLKGHYIIDDTSSGIVSAQGTGASALVLNGRGDIRFTTGGTPTGGTERARIDSSGNLGVGVTSPTTPIDVKSGSVDGVSVRIRENASGNALIQVTDNPVTTARLALSWTNSTTTANLSTTGLLSFTTAGTERARITSGGYFKASNTGTYDNATGAYHELKTSSGNWIAFCQNTATSSMLGIGINYTTTANNTGNQFLYCSDNTALRAEMRSNGGLANYQANDVNLSDERVKTDIKPVGSYWDKLKAIEIVTFKYKDQTHDDDNIGVVAQQVEAVAPEFIDVDGFGETPEDGIPLKTVYTTDMYHAAIKALQEAMTRIESLEARLAALES